MNSKSPTSKTVTSVPKSSVFGSFHTIAFTTLSLVILAITGQVSQIAFLIPPFAATAAYIFGMPNIPGTQPRSVVFGHLISGIVGVLILWIFGSSMIMAALAAGTAMFAMNMVKVFHIPSVATAAFIVLTNPADKPFVLLTLVGASIFLSLMGYVMSKMTGKIQYPLYW